MSNDVYEDTFDYAFDDDGSGGFNSDEDLGIIVNHVAKPLAPNMTESFQDVPGHYGGVFLGTDYGEKQIDIPITIMCADREEYNLKLERLTNVLINTSDDADSQYPLRFNDNPDVVYYGHFTSIPTPTFISENVQDCTTTLTFMMADPRGFLPQKSIKITSNDQTIQPDGNAKVKPIIHIIPKTDLYYVGYETEDEYVAAGYNVDRGTTITDADGNTQELNQSQVRQVNDPCNTLATWFEAGPDTQEIGLYDAVLDGKATSTGSSIMVAKNSKGKYDWGKVGAHGNKFYGPAVIHNGLPKITPYWKVLVRLHHTKRQHNKRAMGKIEAYLLDNNGQTCGRMGIEDYSMGRYPRGFIQLGNNFNHGSHRYLTLLFNEGNAAQKKDGPDNHKVKIPLKKVTKTITKKKKKSEPKKGKKSEHEKGKKSEHEKDHKHEHEKDHKHEHEKDHKHEKSEKKLKPLIVNARKRRSTRDRRRNKNKKERKKRLSSYTTARTKKGRRVARGGRGKKPTSGKKIGSPKSGTKTTKIRKQIQEYKYATSYMESDAYSDFWGDFILERQKITNNGKATDQWIAEIIQYNPSTGEPYSINNDGVTHISKKKLDTSGKFGFALANVGVFFGKHDIEEDLSKPPVVYRTNFESLTSYKEWRTDGSTDPDDNPHIIAKAGDEIVIDTTNNNVTINGQNANKYVSWLSTFPGIQGGVDQKLHFYPDPADANITLDYVPAIK